MFCVDASWAGGELSCRIISDFTISPNKWFVHQDFFKINLWISFCTTDWDDILGDDIHSILRLINTFWTVCNQLKTDCAMLEESKLQAQPFNWHRNVEVYNQLSLDHVPQLKDFVKTIALLTLHCITSSTVMDFGRQLTLFGPCVTSWRTMFG